MKDRQIGFAEAENFFACWEVDTPYIEVFPDSEDREEVREAFRRGETYSGTVHVINTNGDLNESGYPKDGRTPDEYVRDELLAWYEEFGEDYSREIVYRLWMR